MLQLLHRLCHIRALKETHESTLVEIVAAVATAVAASNAVQRAAGGQLEGSSHGPSEFVGLLSGSAAPMCCRPGEHHAPQRNST